MIPAREAGHHSVWRGNTTITAALQRPTYSPFVTLCVSILQSNILDGSTHLQHDKAPLVKRLAACTSELGRGISLLLMRTSPILKDSILKTCAALQYLQMADAEARFTPLVAPNSQSYRFKLL
jgi:hypothetical protein